MSNQIGVVENAFAWWHIHTKRWDLAPELIMVLAAWMQHSKDDGDDDVCTLGLGVSAVSKVGST